MDAHYYGIVEMGFTGLVVLGLALWQLWSINREVSRDRKSRDASADAARHPVGEHRLHDR